MTDYQDKLEARRERLTAKAAKVRAEGDARLARADRLADCMNGQPILVGHHSEKRHRRDLDRMHNDMRRGFAAETQARDLERRAASVGKGGVSADDPDAVAKLRAKLEKMEAARDQAKKINAHWRKHGSMQGFPGISDEGAARIDAKMAAQNEAGASWVPDKQKVYPTYHFTNLGANIRRVRDRITALEREAARPAAERVIGAGWQVVEDADDNRLLFIFDAKPSRDVCRLMRVHGFRWSPSRVAWVRQLNAGARAAADRAAQSIAAATA